MYAADPDDHALALLNEYQNADKHRELNIISFGTEAPRATVTWQTGQRQEIDYPTPGPGTLMGDGCRFFESPEPVTIALAGTMRIAMARGRTLTHRELPESLEIIFDTVGRVLALIEDAM